MINMVFSISVNSDGTSTVIVSHEPLFTGGRQVGLSAKANSPRDACGKVADLIEEVMNASSANRSRTWQT